MMSAGPAELERGLGTLPGPARLAGPTVGIVMTWIALKMLTGDRAKYLGIIAGVTFAALLIAQQASIGCRPAAAHHFDIQDIADVDIWVMDPDDEFIDEIKPLTENDLYRVQGVPGVAWAVPFYKGQGRVKLDAGGPTRGRPSISKSSSSASTTPPWSGRRARWSSARWPTCAYPTPSSWTRTATNICGRTSRSHAGRVFEMNDHRAVIVGICKASDTFQTFPIFYTRYNQAMQFIPQARKSCRPIFVHPAPGLTRTTSAAASRSRRARGRTGPATAGRASRR